MLIQFPTYGLSFSVFGGNIVPDIPKNSAIDPICVLMIEFLEGCLAKSPEYLALISIEEDWEDIEEQFETWLENQESLDLSSDVDLV